MIRITRSCELLLGLGSAVCLGLVFAWTARAQEAGQSDLAALRTVVFETTGQAYLDVRQEALELSDDQFAKLLSPWQKASRDSVPHLLAEILMVRRTEPANTKAFDTMVAEAIANPDMRSRSGRPKYRFKLGQFQPELMSLMLFETVLKLDLPWLVVSTVMWSPKMDYPLNIDRHLAMMRADVSEGVKGRSVKALGRITRDHPDNRIIAPIVEQYKRRRQDASYLYKEFAASGFVSEPNALMYLGTEEALEAMEDLIIFEQIQMPLQGLQPWNDPDSRDQRSALKVQQAALKFRLIAERKILTTTQTDQIKQEISDLDEPISEAHKRVHAKLIWDGLHRRRDQVKDKLEQKQLDELLQQPDDQGDPDSR